MEILRPEREGFGPEARIRMFCKEKHIDREIFWAGFGFQIWLQFLTHIIAAEKSDAIVIDEPDIYLHPDLQHKLFKILCSTGKQIILATHSVEIINQADNEDVVLINKIYRSGRRVNDIEGLQAALEALGSSQNLYLSRLSKGRRVLFFEGQDFQLIKRFASKLSLSALATALNITVIDVGGFSEHRKVENAVWTFKKILNTEIDVAALFDRDYLTQKQLENFLDKMQKIVPRTFVLNRKEIENYLLAPEAIARAVTEKLGRSSVTIDDKKISVASFTRRMLKRATVLSKKTTTSQFWDSYVRDNPAGKKSQATVLSEAMDAFESRWADWDSRIAMVPGKEVLSTVNRLVQKELKVSLTSALIIRHMRKSEIPPEFVMLLGELNRFAE